MQWRYNISNLIDSVGFSIGQASSEWVCLSMAVNWIRPRLFEELGVEFTLRFYDSVSFCEDVGFA